MSGKKGHRAWGKIKWQPTKQPSYQASFIGPDLRRHSREPKVKLNRGTVGKPDGPSVKLRD